MKISSWWWVLAFVGSCARSAGVPTTTAESLAPAGTAVEREMAETVGAFVASLSEPQRTQAVLPFAAPVRTHWNNLPAFAHDRRGAGIRLGDLTDDQRAAVQQLLLKALSNEGYLKASAIMVLDDVLRELSLEMLAKEGEQKDFGRKEAAQFGSMNYWFTVFRDSAERAPWGWRLEGHHLSINFTFADGLTVATPEFMGADPAHVPSGPHAGWRVLAAEEELGRRLIGSLDATQDRLAYLSAIPEDLITGPAGADRLDAIVGVPASVLRPDQRALLRRLIETYMGNMREELAAEERAVVDQVGFERIHVAWAGSLEPGKPFYYRVHGRTLAIEFDNPHGNANHIHSVWHGRDDFGVDLLRQHYQTSSH